MKRLSVFFILLLIPIQALAKDLSGLYNQATLQYWRTRYPTNIEWNFRNAILPALNINERDVLVDVQLSFPLIGEIGKDPLEFYSYLNDGLPIVALPILSIHFFNDLSIAYSWLWNNGFSVETVSDYVAMLKYGEKGRFRGNRYPLPLEALRIPDNALSNPEVDKLSQKILKSAIIWILVHELGHIYYKHPGYGLQVPADQAQRNEIQADHFATEIMRRVGVVPLGLSNFFTIAVHWEPNRGDFSTTQGWKYYLGKTTHPLTSQRLRVLAEEIKKGAEDFARKEPIYSSALQTTHYVAAEIVKLAGLLEDKDIQHSIRIKGECLVRQPRSLYPRRSDSGWPIELRECIKQFVIR